MAAIAKVGQAETPHALKEAAESSKKAAEKAAEASKQAAEAIRAERKSESVVSNVGSAKKIDTHTTSTLQKSLLEKKEEPTIAEKSIVDKR